MAFQTTTRDSRLLHPHGQYVFSSPVLFAPPRNTPAEACKYEIRRISFCRGSLTFESNISYSPADREVNMSGSKHIPSGEVDRAGHQTRLHPGLRTNRDVGSAAWDGDGGFRSKPGQVPVSAAVYRRREIVVFPCVLPLIRACPVVSREFLHDLARRTAPGNFM
jgi:hypothetical protein